MDRTTPRRNRPFRRILSLSAALALPVPSEARPTWTSGTFLYADLCRDSDGSRVGHSIMLRRSPNGDALIYEGAGLPGPVRAGTITRDDVGRTVAFAVETANGPLAFRGTLEAQALTGTLQDGSGARAVRLPRVLRSHAQEACMADTTGSLPR